ncbi:hypothetical protein VTN77DRAFT_9373 [Rasamsonia byssochlamydoides]|uniref:uncharacterized protein n=1 Tax=Rasamsonia byssochlamydoides TaxID=89139 RepID=UPI00374236D4
MAAAAVATTNSAKKDIQTELVYWKRLEGRSATIDFTQPGGEQRFAELATYEERHPVRIHDIRGEESNYTLDKNGFQYVRHDVPELDDWSDEEKVKEILIPKTEELVRQVTGATKTIVFAHRIRCLATDEAKRADNRAPAHSVHSDFTPTGALHNLDITIQDPAEVERLLRGRVLAINVWRPLKTITKDPLAVCDWRSVDPQDDWIAERFVFPHGWNELGKVAHSDRHRWYYLRRQQPQEPLLFKQFDSRATDQGGFTVAHSAFVDPEFVDAEPRQSIEIKMFAFIPEEA